MKASAVETTYFETGRYTDQDLKDFMTGDALSNHNALVIAGFCCRPVIDDEEGKGVNYTLGCGSCSLDLDYRLDDDGWRAHVYVTGAGVIYGDSKIAGEFSDGPEDAVDALLERLEDEAERGPFEQRGDTHTAHEAIEDALEDFLDEEESGEDEGDGET